LGDALEGLTMITRASYFGTVFVALVFCAGLFPGAVKAESGDGEAKAFFTDEGLYSEDFMVRGNVDLGRALDEAAGAGKRLVVFWERKNCGYCEDTHLINLAVPSIRQYLIENFVTVQVNIWGGEPIVDFDGEVLSEEALSIKYGTRSTPTFTFYPETMGGFEGQTGHRAEVLRIPGYIPPGLFAMMLGYVRDSAYEHSEFIEYVDARLLALQMNGP
jgi:thioredoxin-related protein